MRTTIHPTTPGRRPRARGPWAGAAALSAAGLLALATASPAAAHDQLLSASPAAGTAVVETPTELSLTFSGDLITGQGISNLATVTGEAGHQWQDGEPTVSGPELTVPLCEGMPNGVYAVNYRVVYSDGHSEEKDYEFTLEDPGAPEDGAPTDCGVVNPDAPVTSGEADPGATTAASDDAAVAPGDSGSATEPASSADTAESADATAAATAEATAGPDATADAEASEADAESSGVPGWVWPTAIGVVIVLALAMILVFRRAKGIDAGSDRT